MVSLTHGTQGGSLRTALRGAVPDHLVADVEVEAAGVRLRRVGVHRLPVLGRVHL